MVLLVFVIDDLMAYMAVAAAIDAMHWSEVAGCIAGDDTIMCAVRSVDDTLRVMDKISRVVGRK